jgi:hypothetical protein
MSNDRFNPDPYAPTLAEPPGGGGCGRYAIGCGMVTSVVLLLIALVSYLAWPGFVNFTVQTNLAELRDAVQPTNLDPPVRDELVKDLDTLRLSIDDHNNFAFMQWIEIHQELTKIVQDRKIDPRELGMLKNEISRMKKIQGIETK